MVELAAGLCGMAFAFFCRPTPAASAEGVDRGRGGRVQLNNINWQRKNYFLNSTIYFTFLPLIQP
jgi:hypothetical protein